MTSTPQPLSRRGALLAGTAALAGGMGLAGRSDAAVRIPERAHTSLPALKPEQRAGQRVIHSYPGLTPPARLMDAIREGRTAGVIFFGENIESLSQIEGVIQEMNDANASAPVKAPLLLMTDQEGGMVRRLPGEPVLSAKDVGGSTDPEGQAEFTGNAAGMNLAGVGMNVNLAPVLDVYRRAGDFTDQYERSYGKDQDEVGTCGSAFITAQQDAGVAATAKHFPGLGPASANQNTDLGPVTLTTSVSTLRSVDEVPYRAAISAGTKLVMLSWAVYRALDADRPAGLSPTVVGELRNRLGFPGVTVTDALEAGALRAYGSTAERAVLAAAAGMDLILCSARDAAQGEEAVTALSEALAAGTLDGTAFDAGAERVNALRGSLS
ncbi:MULTISPECIES: glycoside hydrolase family 3 N-terminal domain-containing protein [unclassified Streptomyces]|uniref:glycoside hydrolase family 3 N-terminal domain-containing protein n=1 Tax=unclassified Streptomyces TaxID=2593676 RepID=UPI000F5BBE21|nr:glycoside hydrolase family 3 N-terminal domain-containing protein [Streptomyces sp. ADI95-17]RPK61177.1 putative lipoprotein YbbD precursor [Streptomyces sp. ADI95-17]WSG48766.1 beta-N-acetylhexosaminidase [Streptomyces sp. NBC_01732]WSW99416.1 beta-N-acetylhexosaminidase [Streptomyces sp. NBC_00987]